MNRCSAACCIGDGRPYNTALIVLDADFAPQWATQQGLQAGSLEALACDVPVLATDVGIAPLALEGIAGTLCAPFERSRWSTAVAPHLAADDPRIDGRIRAALFDRNRLAARVFRAYQDVVGGS